MAQSVSFQFQYGTIKSGQKLAVSAIFLFQFQYGTIKTYKGHTSRQLDFDFNSIMVQLKHILKVSAFVVNQISIP